MQVTEDDRELEAAIQRTRVEINDVKVDPWDVTVGQGRKGESSRISLKLGAAFLLREISDGGTRQRSGLVVAVTRSLREHGESAMHGYLGMIRGDYRPEVPVRKGTLRWLPWLRRRSPRWVWTGWEEVTFRDDEDVVVISGTCFEA